MAPTYAVPGWLLELLTLTNHMLKFPGKRDESVDNVQSKRGCKYVHSFFKIMLEPGHRTSNKRILN